MKSFLFIVYLGTLFNAIDEGLSHKWQANVVDKIGAFFGLKKSIGIVVLDAGNTETHLSYYEFIISSNKKTLKLSKDFHRSVKPSLLSYVDKPSKCGQSLQPLLDQLKLVLPVRKWVKTHVVLMGTGGFRLISESESFQLLNAAKNFFVESGFKVMGYNIISLTGSNEALLDWFTINLLKNRMGKYQRTLTTLVLGSTSAQVSFQPKDDFELPIIDRPFLSNLWAYGNNYNLYCRSYLGLGLDEARHLILRKTESLSVNVLSSECLGEDVKTAWTYNGIEYIVKGSPQATEDISTNYVNSSLLNRCQETVREIVSRYSPSATLTNKEIVAYGEYFYIAFSSGLVKTKRGGKVNLAHLKFATKFRCENLEPDHPFLCLDLVYITTLFTDIFGLVDYDVINFVGSVHGFNADWTLGAAFLTVPDAL